MITPITDHKEQAKAKLLMQYKGKPKIEGTVDALVIQLQELEDVLTDLRTKRLSIDDAEGFQLDKIGEIINQTRGNLTDVDYRLLLKVRILITISNCEPETVIHIFNLLTKSTATDYREDFPAEHSFYSNVPIDITKVDMIRGFLEDASLGGVLVGVLGSYDPDNAFAFDGVLTNTGGFGDLLDANAGGKLAQLY